MMPQAPHTPKVDERPAHVLFVIDQLCETGGAERVLLNTIRLLPKDRFRCSLITFKKDDSLELFRNLPCPHAVYPLRRTYDVEAFRTFLQIRDFLKRENVQIVHTFHETSDLWAGMISKIGGNRILISNRRDMGFLRSKKHDIGYRLMNPAFDLVLTVSEEVRQFCISHDRLTPEKVVTLYNGLELKTALHQNGTASLRSQLGLSQTTPLVLTVGHVRPVKGFDVLVETAALVSKQNPDAVFVIIGHYSDTPHFRQIQERVQQLEMQRNVIFLGAADDVSSLLQQGNIFFLPSRSEGFSNALIEAMACGLPCVATRVGGNPEAVEEGRSGYVVESEDSQTAADRILRLLRDPEAAMEMGRAGRTIVESKFTADVMIQQLVGHYERLLAARRN